MMRVVVNMPHGELRSPSVDVFIDVEDVEGARRLVVATDSEFSRCGELGVFLNGGYLLSCSGEILNAASGALCTLKSFVDSIDCDVMRRFGRIEADIKYLEYAIGLFGSDPSVRLEIGENALSLVRRKREEFEKEPELSMLAGAELYPHQKEAVRFLRSRCLDGSGWGLLALDQGTGKTLAVISFILDLMSRTPYAVSLIACPTSVVGVWVEHFERHAPSLRVGVAAGSQEQRANIIGDYESYDVIVTTLGCLRRDSLEYARSALFDVFVVDECDALKNHSSRIRSAARRVRAARRIGLSGTPFPNATANEIHSVLACLSNDSYLGTQAVFNERFSAALEGDGDPAMLRALKHLIEPCIMRKLKEDVLRGLPQKVESEVYVDLPEEQRAVYDAFEKGLRDRVMGMNPARFEKERMHVFAALTNLRQLAISPAAVYPDYVGPAVKIDMAINMSKAFADEGHKVVIFTLFVRDVVDRIFSGLSDEGVSCEALTGDVPADERDKMISRFSSDDGPKVLVISKAGGSGISLVSADVEIVLCPHWHLSASDQAIDRLHRIGQRKEVRAFHLLCRDTIEERMVELRERKRRSSESIMRQSDRTSLTRITRSELIELLGGMVAENE